MRNGIPGHSDGDHILLCILDALADCFGHFGCLTQAKADLALAVADYHQDGELHDTAALNGLADAVEIDQFFDIFAGRFFKSRHILSSS